MNIEWSAEKRSFIEDFTQTPFSQLYIKKLAGDASQRHYWRIQKKKTSWILLETDPFNNPDQYPFINVQNHLEKHKVHVPKIFAHASSLGLILIEDFGNTSLEQQVQKLSPQKYGKYYFLALKELFKIHFDSSAPSECVAFSLAFDTEKLLQELKYMQTYLIEQYLSYSLSSDEQKCVDSFFLPLCKTLSHEPRYFTHRDFHSRNLMVIDHHMGVLDFQDARMGPCQYDLVSLLRDAYVKIPAPLVSELLQYYIDEKEHREKKKVDLQNFYNTFDLMALQRNLKAMGTFAYLHIDKKKPQYLPYIKPTFEYVNETLRKFPEYKAFHELLLQVMKRCP